MRNSKKGYSLAEAAIVITALSLCVGLLVYGIAMPQWKRLISRAKAQKIHGQLSQLVKAYDDYCAVSRLSMEVYGSEYVSSESKTYHGTQRAASAVRPDGKNECHPRWPWSVGNTAFFPDFLIAEGYLDEHISISRDSFSHYSNTTMGIRARRAHFVNPNHAGGSLTFDINKDGWADSFVQFYSWSSDGEPFPDVCAAYNELFTDFGYNRVYAFNMPQTSDLKNGRITTMCYKPNMGKWRIVMMVKSGREAFRAHY